MALFVNTNTSSLNAQRQLLNSGNSLDVAFKRLSSGFRINSASDDAAGLQISNRLTSQINGLDQASRNANDGISLAQVAEGAMEEITTSLQRMRVLVVQSENGINGTEDKKALQKEINALNTEISRIADTTKFGDRNLLNGDGASSTFSFLVGAQAEDNDYIKVSLGGPATDGWSASALGVAVVNVSANGCLSGGSNLSAIDKAK